MAQTTEHLGSGHLKGPTGRGLLGLATAEVLLTCELALLDGSAPSGGVK